MHIDQEQRQRFLHGELDPPADRAVRDHFAMCEDCRLQLEDEVREEQEVNEWLGKLDHPSPALSAAAVMAPQSRAGPRASGSRKGRVWVRRVAAVLVLGAAGAAYALPGSPVRGWVDNVIDQVSSAISEFSAAARGVDPAAVVESSSPESVPQPSGLGVPPGSSLIVVFETAQPERTVDVVMYDGDEVFASASGGTASFTSEDDRLLIGNAGSTAHYEIRIPRTAQLVEIRVGERSVFLKSGQTVTTESVANGDGVWVIKLADGATR